MSRALLIGAVLLAGLTGMGQVAPPRQPATRPSPADVVSIILEGTPQQGKRGAIYYSRPHTKAPGTGEVRKIWGGLVPWNQVWRLGANEATLLVTELPLQFGDVTVPAGAHTLWMLPVENGPSKLIINKQIGQSGTDYDEKQDLARIDLKKEDLSGPVDRLTLVATPVQGGGAWTLKICWENAQYSVDFKLKK